jgi:tetratricopeptide (TPR) repeat protein
MFDLQDAISTKVAQVLAPHLERRDRKRLAGAGGTRNLDAYQLYLAARHQAQGIRTAGLVKSFDLYRQAIALDPDYALAYVGIAESHRRMIFGADGEPTKTFAEAERHARRAVEIAPDLAEAHAGIAWNRFWHDWDWSGAEAAFRQAIALNPSESNAHFGYSQLLETLGRDAEAIEQLRMARELDPLSIILLTLESGSLFFAGKRDEARQRLQRVFDIEPDFWVAYMAQAGMLGAEGKTAEAIASLERANRFADGSSQAAAALGFLLARSGDRERALQVLARLDAAAKTRYVPPTSAGLIHIGLGDKAAALDALDRGFASRDVRMTLVKADGRWKPLRDDPRFAALMQRMKLA